MRSLQPTLTDMFGSEPPTDPKAAVWEEDEVTVVKDDHDSGSRAVAAPAEDQEVAATERAGASDEDEVTAVAKLSDLRLPTSLGAPDGDDETEEAAVPTTPRQLAPPPPATPSVSRLLPATLRAPVPPPPTRAPARKTAPPPPPTIRSAGRDSARPPPPPDPSVATPGPARALLLKPPPSNEMLPPPPRSLPPPPPSSRPTYVPPSLPPRGRLKLDSTDKLPSVGLPPGQLPSMLGFVVPPAMPPIPPPAALPALPQSLAPTSLSNPPPPTATSWKRPLRASGVAVLAGVVLGSCLTLGVFALSRRGTAAGSDAELVMTAAGANGAALRGVELFVNGERRCSQMPCRVEGVGSGAHLVRLTVRETPKQTPHLSLDQLPPDEDKPAALEPQDRSSRSRNTAHESSAPAEQPVKESAPVKSNDPPAKEAASSATETPRGNSAPAAKEPAAASPGAGAAPAVTPVAPLGTIHVTSNAPANVAVDGRVLGRAPRSIRVSSGVHTIVVAGAKGRRVQVVRIDKGRTRRVAARF
jgi:hypothetical protein